MAKILIVEDETHIAKGLELNLSLRGHQIEIVNRGDEVLNTFSREKFDLVVLDLMLPGLNGEKVLEKIRGIDETFPVLVISAKDELQSKIQCFNLGGDDYLSKPFHLEEFLARVERLLKRSQFIDKKVVPKFVFEKYWIDFDNLKAMTNEGEIQLTKQEQVLLELFVQNESKALKRGDILKVLGMNEDTSTRTIDNFIVRFRKYFEENPKEPKHFVSLRSVGYIFNK